jgi:UDP-N-acetylglucosamine--N-acetylmuramyl-(pentapeptide) pyrophosphoryl-undecaprenol N-acetylglucosamine transferase
MQNARYMESQGCAVVIPQDELNEEVLVRVILELVENQNKLKSMQAAAGQIAKPNAASELAIQLKSLGRPNTSRTLKR